MNKKRIFVLKTIMRKKKSILHLKKRIGSIRLIPYLLHLQFYWCHVFLTRNLHRKSFLFQKTGKKVEIPRINRR